MIKEHWNNCAENYGKLIRDSLSGTDVKNWKNFIFNDIDEKKDLKILDIGTGPGFFPIILSSENRKVIGIDLSDKMVEEAKKNLILNNVDAEIIQMDCQETSFEDNSFDLIICRNLTWTLPKPLKAYEEWHRILKKGGKLMIFDGSWYIHHYDTDAMNDFQKKAEELQEKYGIKAHNYGDKELYPEDYKLMKSLYLSDKIRPKWDCISLNNIGFNVIKTMNNYLDEIMSKEDVAKRDSIAPLFYILAEK